ncbi:bcl-2-like protein 12 [Hemicordylus capensis]|uniref:bcl-2-like protein 12 n=1 Tax=Hemicordylus capensis TaxID=884348 RepID=UPI0023047D23|nr:bcl-2-like protein 12 [Hemicordylus capensis]XP_053115114.1 bcl-2-like protein 12 [Hemicordylus capensis]XP_053115115.1 bcl-2-like protein 12 [Hemicordylus capensis]XP_053115116.1 bcl-2-like protein 12 [Hemicordylus capensis]XP_053115117.1 bcl-2-like protein 12 [Hemicordylus capensis]
MAGSLVKEEQVKEETRLVLEAFLQKSMNYGEAGPLGHVGRAYHDPQSYMHRSSGEHAQQCPSRSTIHEETNRVEERKHGFRNSFRRLLQRRPSPQGSPVSPSPSNRDSLKRPKAEGEGARQKHTFSFKNLVRKKTPPSEEMRGSAGSSRRRPNSLPVVTCYCRKHPGVEEEPQPTSSEAAGDKLYTLAARKLEHLVKQQQQLISPGAAAKDLLSPIKYTLPKESVYDSSVDSDVLSEEMNESRKEQILQRLIALLEEQAGVINKEIEADPLLHNTVARMSYRSFSHLAEAFTSQAAPGVPSPQLAKLALTMELTRKVAGINSHTVHTLMGYSLKYMDMFVPWLQQQGGWENIVAQDDIFELQLD